MLNQMGMGIESLCFLIDVVIHERLPITVEGHTTQSQQCLSAGDCPVHAGAFQAVFDHMSAGAFDHAGGNGITGRQGLVLVQTLVVMVKILANLSPSFPMGRG